jgi:glycosyltransferase involved in cell wall biosynthesis
MNSRAPGHLHIAQIAPVAAAVGPDSDDSVTGLVFLLTEELVRRGYRVTLFATADSQTSAELTALYEHGYEDDEEQWDWQFNESMNVANACARADQFDLIHCHTVPYGLPFAPFVDIPTIHTLHGDVGPSVVEAYHYFAGVQVVAVSQFQRRRFEDRPNVELIHHGIDIEAFPFSPGAGDYLLFLGRMSANNGPGQAVESRARAARGWSSRARLRRDSKRRSRRCWTRARSVTSVARTRGSATACWPALARSCIQSPTRSRSAWF